MSARSIISRFGGIRAMARTLGHANQSTVQGWWVRNTVPSKRISEVLATSRDRGMVLNLEEFFAPDRSVTVHVGEVSRFPVGPASAHE
jgi:hypothetical protein